GGCSGGGRRSPARAGRTGWRAWWSGRATTPRVPDCRSAGATGWRSTSTPSCGGCGALRRSGFAEPGRRGSPGAEVGDHDAVDVHPDAVDLPGVDLLLIQRGLRVDPSVAAPLVLPEVDVEPVVERPVDGGGVGVDAEAFGAAHR